MKPVVLFWGKRRTGGDEAPKPGGPLRHFLGGKKGSKMGSAESRVPSPTPVSEIRESTYETYLSIAGRNILAARLPIISHTFWKKVSMDEPLPFARHGVAQPLKTQFHQHLPRLARRSTRAPCREGPSRTRRFDLLPDHPAPSKASIPSTTRLLKSVFLLFARNCSTLARQCQERVCESKLPRPNVACGAAIFWEAGPSSPDSGSAAGIALNSPILESPANETIGRVKIIAR